MTDYLTPDTVRNLMSDYNIRATHGRQKGKLSVRKLATLANCPYNSLNLAMNGNRPFSEAIKLKLHYYFLTRASERAAKDFDQ